MEGYSKVRQIGKGNMGTCLLAKNPQGELVVLKQVSMGKMGEKERRQAVSEAKLLKSVRHPNIVKYENSWVTKSDNLMIAMEYATKGDLCSKIEKCKGKALWKESHVLDWFIQIALAVHYTGKKHILHRDLKTQNILISEEGILKLADFGISRSLINTWEEAHTFVGTPYYLAPELVMQQPYNIQVDAWAVGVVLCEMLTLTHPFTGYDMKSLTKNIVNGVYAKPHPSYSADIRAIVTSLLRKDPKKRATIKEVLQTEIVQRRIHAWLTDDTSINKAYIKDLVFEGCLDEVVPAIWVSDYSRKNEAQRPERAPSAGRNQRDKSAAADKIIEDIDRQRRVEKEKIKNEFDRIDAGGLRLHNPSAPRGSPSAARDAASRRSPSAGSPSVASMAAQRAAERDAEHRLPNIAGANGYCPPAHPRELLAEKRRILAMLEKQQQQQQQQQQHHAHRPIPGRRFRNMHL